MKGSVAGRSPDSYKAIFISDIHMRNSWPYSRPTGRRHRTDRFEDQLKLWRHVRDTAVSEGVEDVNILGDLFDCPLPDPVTMAGTVEALQGVAEVARVRILPGNHDEHKSGAFQTEVFGEVKGNISLFGHGARYTARSWLNFWPYHYRKTGLEDDIKAFGEPELGSFNVALIHQSIKGCSHLGWVCDDGLPPELFKSFDYILSGHFHDHQKFMEDRGMYLSAPMQHHFGDIGRETFYWVVEFQRLSPWKTKKVDPGLPRFHAVNWDDDYVGVAEPGDFLRIDVHKTPAELDSLRDSIAEVEASLRDAGVRAHVKTHPIYHHGARLLPETGDTKVFSIPGMLQPYVEHAGVSTDGLDEDLLLKMGRQFMAEVDSAIGH